MSREIVRANVGKSGDDPHHRFVMTTKSRCGFGVQEDFSDSPYLRTAYGLWSAVKKRKAEKRKKVVIIIIGCTNSKFASIYYVTKLGEFLMLGMQYLVRW